MPVHELEVARANLEKANSNLVNAVMENKLGKVSKAFVDQMVDEMKEASSELRLARALARARLHY